MLTIERPENSAELLGAIRLILREYQEFHQIRERGEGRYEWLYIATELRAIAQQIEHALNPQML